jgi:hypothetical protein
VEDPVLGGALVKDSGLSFPLPSTIEELAINTKRIDVKMEAFESSEMEERLALNELMSEAVARTAEAKSKDRVRRIARILANAFRSGPKENYEMSES